MKSFPQRTGLTQLSDDELLLFDFMFACKVEERLLRRDKYPLHMNVNYSHNLNNEQLQNTLKRLEQQKMLVVETEGGLDRWSLTPLAGTQWELERKPCWDAYCQDIEKPLRTGKHLMMVFSPVKATAETFWNVGVQTKLWIMGNGQPRYWRIQNHQLIPWRVFSAIHVFAGIISEWDTDTDWEMYEAKRTWWRDITELDSLRKMLS